MTRRARPGSPIALLDAADLIASVPPFDSLPAGTLVEVASVARSQRFEPGATILAQDGPPSDALYVIGSGTAEILEGTRLIDEPGVGQAFGELSGWHSKKRSGSSGASSSWIATEMGTRY